MMSKFLFGAIFALTITALCATPAAAQEQLESDVSGSFELKFGPYYPDNIDGGVTAQDGSTGSFESFYGAGNLVYGELVIDRYFFEKFGKAGVGVHAGYTRRKGAVQSTMGDTDSSEMAEGEESAIPGETKFRLVPLRASLFYKYDYSAQHHNIPLVPVVRAGLDYYLWRIIDSNGDTSKLASGEEARGGKAGWHASFGLHLLLDYIDPASAASFDVIWGVNNSYLFAEYMITRIDGFGAGGFDLSDNVWMFGLAFEF